MTTRQKLAVVLVSVAFLTGCLMMAGSMIGRGIGKATGGDEEAGALIGGGVGLMVGVM
jgi:hypothetical protein